MCSAVLKSPLLTGKIDEEAHVFNLQPYTLIVVLEKSSQSFTYC